MTGSAMLTVNIPEIKGSKDDAIFWFVFCHQKYVRISTHAAIETCAPSLGSTTLKNLENLSNAVRRSIPLRFILFCLSISSKPK